MGEMTSEGANAGAGIDLSQFYQVFFEEAGENLDRMEQHAARASTSSAADDEELNAIFRCAHSVKGGAATFGFADVAELTHQMETLLDKLRRHELAPHRGMVDVLLAAGDALRAQLARHQGGGGDDASTPPSCWPTSARWSPAAAAGGARRRRRPPAAAAAAPAAARRPPTPTCASSSSRVGPLDNPSRPTTWSSCSRRSPTSARSSRSTPARRADGMRRFKVVTTQQRQRPAGPVHLPRRARAGEAAAAEPGLRLPRRRARRARRRRAEADPGYGFFDDAPGAPADGRRPRPPRPRRAGASAPTGAAPRRAPQRRQGARRRARVDARCASRSRRSTS